MLGVVLALGALHYAFWLYLIRDANDLLRDGRLADAAAAYERAAAWTPPLAAYVPAARVPLAHTLLKQAQILHIQQKRNETLGFMQGLRSRYPFMEREPQFHLWYGNALFVRAIFQEDPQVMVSDFQAALRAYQTSLELDPASWDARYNYEFIKRALMAEGEQGQQQLKLLLDEKERPKRDEKLPPEKVG